MEVVLLACGSSPLGSDLPGLQGAGIVSLDDYLAGRATVGEGVVILGGNEGAEAAVSLAREKKEVTMVEPSGTIAAPFYLYDILRRGMLLEHLQQEEVKILTRTQRQEVRTTDGALAYLLR